MFIYMYKYVKIYMYLYICIYTYTQKFKYTHMYIYTYIYLATSKYCRFSGGQHAPPFNRRMIATYDTFDRSAQYHRRMHMGLVL